MKEKQHRLLSPSDSMYTCEDKTKLYFNLKANKGERDETEAKTQTDIFVARYCT